MNSFRRMTFLTPVFAICLAKLAMGRPLPTVGNVDTTQIFYKFTTETPLDNSKECLPPVLQAIHRARSQWGDFHFTCIEGLVRNLFVDGHSKINRQQESFISSNMGMFLIDPASSTVRVRGWGANQVYQGDEIMSRTVFWEYRDGEVPSSAADSKANLAPSRKNRKSSGYFIYEFIFKEPSYFRQENYEEGEECEECAPYE